ncbi:hypothetical protein chiPu_0014248 [Chiloscyllium punctatum]|uniref:Secreted protein n=1 Tax=Chiloscyllium punctatum TaxID=137246 RepID=A0A401SZF2_CHIPU|nr:hypothetical protein [Chiloscyllium punctatum]
MKASIWSWTQFWVSLWRCPRTSGTVVAQDHLYEKASLLSLDITDRTPPVGPRQRACAATVSSRSQGTGTAP